MATLSVGPGQQFTTIGDAVAAASPGDTIDIDAGTYNDDFLIIEQSLTLQAVGGPVVMTEDTEPPDGKAMITEGQPGLNVTINGFDISGVSVGDQNGAAIRYEGGNLTLNQDYFHDNQEGLLAASDPNGTITINDSEFADNGDGSGFTHNIYVNQLATLTVENSYIHDAVVGHDIKSRADDTVITNDRITDTNNGPGNGASYEIDIPNGGNATITDNVIEKGPNAQNPYIIAYGEEGNSNPGTSVTIADNTIVNDDNSPYNAVVLNRTGVSPLFSGNQIYGLTASQITGGGGAAVTDDGTNVYLAARPSLDTSSLSFSYPPQSGGTGGSGGGGGGTGTGGGNGGSSGGSGGGTGTQPPPSLPLIDQATWQAEVFNDFVTYATANPAAWSDPNAIQAFSTEFLDPLTGSQGIPAAAAWGPFPT